MKYIIGKVLTEHIQKQNMPFRRYAIAHDVSELDLTLIRNGHRGASPEKLSKLIDIEQLRQPMIDDIKENIENLDTEHLICVYNSIYHRVKASETSQD